MAARVPRTIGGAPCQSWAMAAREVPSDEPVRTVVVLGGGSDIAAAVVAQLVASGLEEVVLVGRDPDRFGVPAAGGLTVHRVAWDALDPAGHDRMVAAAIRRLGGRVPDLVLCAVGSLGHHSGLGVEAVEADRSLRTNVVGPAAALLAWGRTLAAAKAGTIVVLSSVAGVRTRRSNFVYGAGKAGLDAFALGLGDALLADGVRVLVVRPGFVTSKMTDGLDPAPFATDPHTVAAAVVAAVARGRTGVVWVPGVLRFVFGLLRVMPRPVWRRIAGDR